MVDVVCKCCGQTLPQERPFAYLRLSGKRIQILEMVRKAGKHGIEGQRIFNILYENDPDGGPLSGMKLIHVHVCQINKILRSIGKEIRGERIGRHKYESGKYWLTDVV